MNTMVNNNMDGTRTGYRKVDQTIHEQTRQENKDLRNENMELINLNTHLQHQLDNAPGWIDFLKDPKALMIGGCLIGLGVGIKCAVDLGIEFRNGKRNRLEFLKENENKLFEFTTIGEDGYPELIQLTPEEYWEILKHREK